MNVNGRRLMRALLRFYVRRMLIHKGKNRLINWLGPSAADGPTLVPFQYDQGIAIELDLTEFIQSRIYYFGYYEKAITDVLNAHLHVGMDFVDVGANIGYFALMAASRLASHDRVHAFEPDTSNLNRLRGHIALNGFTNVEVNPFAVSNVTGPLTFYSSPTERNRGQGALRLSQAQSQSAQICQAIRLDDYFMDKYPSRCQKVGLIKIDIEGAELLALQGASKLLRHRPTVVLEASDICTQRFGYSTLELRRYLRAQGYECYKLTSRGLHRVSDEARWLNEDLICLTR